jgi:uncharacterized damage-inducible protein DinB
MNALSLIRHFTRNNAWSNLRLLQACRALSEEEYKARRTSFFPSLHKTLTHIAVVDDYYIDALEGGKRARAIYDLFDKEEPFSTLAQVSDAQRWADDRLAAFVDGLPDDASLDREVTLQRRDGPHVDHVGAVLSHLFVHQIHHRGQVHAMLSGTGVKPPQLDEYFLVDDRATAERELAESNFPRIRAD